MIRRLLIICGLVAAGLASSASKAEAGFATLSFNVLGDITYTPNINAGLNNATSITFESTDQLFVSSTPPTFLGNPNDFRTSVNAAPVGVPVGSGITTSSATLPVSNINGPLTALGITLVFGTDDRYTVSAITGFFTSTGVSNLSFDGQGTFVDSTGNPIFGPNTTAQVSFTFTQTTPGSAVGGTGTISTPSQFVPPGVPEPASMTLAGVAVAGLVARRLRRKA